MAHRVDREMSLTGGAEPAGLFRTVEYRGAQLNLPVYLDHHATTPLEKIAPSSTR